MCVETPPTGRTERSAAGVALNRGERLAPTPADDVLVSGSALDRARAGNEEAFRDLIAPHLRELHLHRYRMLDSLADADDLLQETLAAAWRGLDSFAGRSSLRSWLYRIATNRCLNAARATRRRSPPQPAPRSLRPNPPARAR